MNEPHDRFSTRVAILLNFRSTLASAEASMDVEMVRTMIFMTSPFGKEPRRHTHWRGYVRTKETPRQGADLTGWKRHITSES